MTLQLQWRYLLVMDLDGLMWIDTRGQFGGLVGCGVFGQPADLWKEILQRCFALTMISRWVDDNLIIKRSSRKTSIQDIVALSRTMGVKTNNEKISEFSDEQKYIGFIWNAPDRTVRLPDGKLKERVSQISYFLQPEEKFTHKEVEYFMVRLNHTVQIFPNLQCYLQSLCSWKKEWFNKAAKRTLPLDAKEDLTAWLETLSVFKTRHLFPDYEVTSVDWVGDAVSSYGIGVLIGPRWYLWKMKIGWELDTASDKVRGIFWAESIAVRIGLLMLKRLGPTRGKKIPSTNQ